MSDDKPKITVRGVDITEHVASLFDALITSIDWGSGCLSVEEIESLLIIAALAGFTVPSLDAANMTDVPGVEPLSVLDQFRNAAFRPEFWQEKYKEFRYRQEAAVRAWAEQVAAKARAMATDET